MMETATHAVFHICDETGCEKLDIKDKIYLLTLNWKIFRKSSRSL